MLGQVFIYGYILSPDGAGQASLPFVEAQNILVWPKQLTTGVIVYDNGIR